MSKKRRGKSWYGRCKKQRVLAFILCMMLVFGGICVPEGTVQAAETADIFTEIFGEEIEYTSEENSSIEELSSSWDAVDAATGGSVSGNTVMTLSLDGAEDDIASGTYENITWRIDVNGKLTVEGTGEFSDSTGGRRAPWYSESGAVKSAEIRISGLCDASYMFYGCSSLTSVDMSGFNTSSVTSMIGMFYGCSGLTSLDVSGFDTSGVSFMTSMFSGCSGLTSLDLSGFDTSGVTSMTSMFSGCSGLTSLDLSGFDTSGVTSMNSMFSGCSGLTSLDLSGFGTSRVTAMRYMFNDCSGLTILDVNGFDTSNVTDMNYMFCGCSSLTSLDVSGFDTSNVTDMSYMFFRCSSLTSLDVSKFDTSRVSGGGAYFRHTCSNGSHGESHDLGGMANMFYGCSGLTSLDVSKFDTNSVGSMYNMFNGCSGLTSLDVSGFDTSSVTDMASMFYGCSGLTSLDVSGFDTSNVVATSGMFGGCSGLTSLDVSGFDMSSVTSMYAMFSGCKGLTSLDMSGFDTSSVTDMCNMFYRCSGLMNLDVSMFDTSGVTGMGYMFDDCSSLTSLDLSSFDTSNVTDMNSMFTRCSNLMSLDVSGFDTRNVTDMRMMFSDCSSLTRLDVSRFDTSGVTDMGLMFSGCSGLTSLDVSGFDTSNVVGDKSSVEFGQSTNVSTSCSRYPAGMGGMFSGCSSLTNLDVSGFDTSNVKSMTSMFNGCSGLTSLDVSGFDTSNVIDMGSMFYGCSGLTSLDVSGFGTSNVIDIEAMFYDCSNLISLDVSGFDTSNIIHMHDMFRNCSGLTSLDVSSFDTSNVTFMASMFSGCSGLTSLDVSSFDTSNVTNMGNMFYGCSGLTTLYTPYIVPASNSCDLPTAEKIDVWYDSDGTTYKSLPRGLDHSIFLMKNTKPDTAMASRLTVLLSKSVYEPGSVVKPEDLTVKYRGTDGKTITLSYKGEDSEASGYTMSAVDMSTPGEKTLTVSYNDGTNTLTGSVTFTVSVLLSDSMVTLPEGEYVYNGKAHKPIPVVKSADGETLTRGKDYAVSYTDNVDAGEAVLSVIGRNAYGGTVTKNFTVQRATLENVEMTFSEPCGKAQENRTRNLSSCFDKIAQNHGGITSYTIGEITEHDSVANGGGSVLSGTPSIDESGVLTYGTNEGTAGDTVSIPITVTFAKNYKDAVIHVTICLQDKVPVVISGITMKNSTYNGSLVSPEGTAAVRTEGEAGEDVTELVTLAYHYTGTQADGTAYDSDTAPTHAGSYILNVAVAENDSYEGSAEYSFEIGKVPLTVTAADKKLVIGEFDTLPDESTLTCEITGLCGTHTAQDVLSTQPVVSYGLNGEKIDKASIAIDKAGSYDLLPSGAVLNRTAGADYEITEQSYRKGTITIVESGSGDSTDPTDPKDPTKPDDSKDPEFPDDDTFRVSAVPAQTYTGSAIKPVVTVYYGSRRLTEKTDYTVTYKNNNKANDATVERTAPTITVTGKGNYSGKQTVTFVIEPKNIAKEDVTAAELIAAQSSKVQKPVPVLTYQGKKLKNKTDFTVSYPDENKTGAYQTAGTYAVTVTGTGNYTGTKSLTYTITDKTLLKNAKVAVKAKDYTGSDVTLNAEDITVKVGKATLAYGTDYTLSYRNNTQTGKATVIVTGAGENYAGSKEATFQIKGESIAKAQITGIVNKTYTGASQTQDIQVQLNGKTLRAGEDYAVAYAKEVNTGTATVTVTGKGGYTGTVKKSFKIMAYDLQTNEGGRLQGAPQNLTVAYTKGGATPTLTLTFDGTPLVAKKDYTVTYKNNKKPASASDAKAPTMVIKGKGNFKGTVSIPFAITVSSLETDGNVTITAADTAYVNKAGKYMAKPVLTDANGKKLTAGTDYEKTFTYTLVGDDGTEKALTAEDIVPVGSDVKVTVTGKGNYPGTLSTTYRITEASFAKAKITVTPQAYTGDAVTLSAKDITVKLNGNTLTYGTDYTIVEGSYQNNIKKGTASVTIKGLGSYGGTKTVKFKITAKLLATLLKF